MTDLEKAQLATKLLDKIVMDMDIDSLTYYDVLGEMVGDDFPEEDFEAVVKAASKMWSHLDWR